MLTIAKVGCCVSVGALASFLFCAEASADIPAWVRQWQDTAPEAAEIEIVSATADVLAKNEIGRHLDIRADAKVLTVERTHAGIRAGAVICLHYGLWSADDLLPGATPIRIVATGDRLKAFIAKRSDDTCFAPAAEGQSFVGLGSSMTKPPNVTKSVKRRRDPCILVKGDLEGYGASFAAC